MDQLSMDAKRAMDDGYGIHYGLWKSLHPNTREENEPLIAKFLEDEKKTASEKRIECRMKECPVCGEKFLPSRANRVCCSEECRKKYNFRKMGINMYKTQLRTAVCQECGKEFQHTGRSSRKYCCAECANNHRNRERREAAAILRAMGLQTKPKPQKRAYVLYTVYDNQTGKLMIRDATAEKCAEVLGIKTISFRAAAGKSQNKDRRWRIEKREA